MVHWFDFLCVFFWGGGVWKMDCWFHGSNVRVANFLLLHILYVYIGNWIWS
jgi:hypothetical protein